MQALKGVVIFMTLMIAVVMTLIGYGLYQKSQDSNFKFFDHSQANVPAEQSQPDLPAATPFSDITLPLGPDAHIVSASASNNRLVIVTAAPDGERVWLVDLATGQILGQVKTQKAP